jgi:hypothetical protein
MKEIEVFEIADSTALPAHSAHGWLGRLRGDQARDIASGKAISAYSWLFVTEHIAWKESDRSAAGERRHRCRMCGGKRIGGC